MNESLWVLSNVSLGSRQQRLANVTLTLPAGVTAIIGPSGAGKTSLLNVLVGFEKPQSGRIERTFRPRRDRLPIGWVPPDFGLWPHLSVRDHLTAVHRTEAGSVAGLLEGFRLAELADARCGRLSQGERSRLAVARALAGDPEVLVMDEPLVHVDPVHLDDDWRIVRDYCRNRAAALVFSTHAPQTVLREAAHVVCLDAGRVAYSGSVRALYDDPPSERLSRFLGPANWFGPQELGRWISGTSVDSGPVCVRPDRLRMEAHPHGELVLRTTQPAAAVTVSQVEQERTHEVRTVYHRTAGDGPVRGTRVRLRLCMMLLATLVVAGCQMSSAAPELDVVSTRTLKIAVDGASIPAPRSLTVAPDGELYVLDKAGRVLVYSAEGTLDRQWRMPDYEVGKPEGVCVLADGSVAVADTHYHRVVIFDRHGTVLRMFGELGEGPGQFIYPVSITRDDAGNLYVAEYGGSDRIQKFTSEGEWLLTMGSFGTAAGQFQRPSGVVWRRNDGRELFGASSPGAQSGRGALPRGTLYVADAINNRVQAFADDGTFLGVVAGWAGTASPATAIASSQAGERRSSGTSSVNPQPSTFDPQPSAITFDYPYDIALGPDDTLFVVEYGAGRVTSLTVDGKLIGRYGTTGRGDGQFWTPWGIAAADDGRVFVADTGNKRIVEFAL